MKLLSKINYIPPAFIQKPSWVLLIVVLLGGITTATANLAPLMEFGFGNKNRVVTHDILERLDKEHYRKLEIDDEFAEKLLSAYLENLDPLKIYFTQKDVEQFSKYSKTFDNHLIRGNLDPAKEIFHTFYISYNKLLSGTIDNLEQQIADMDFTLNDHLIIDIDTIDYPVDGQASIKRWNQQVKNDVLNLRIADKTTEEIITILKRRYTNRLDRLNEVSAEKSFDTFINTLTQIYDPHTSWLSPSALDSFKISMSLSLEGIGAVLQRDGEYTKVVRLVTAGPAQKQGKLKPGDRVVGVAQDGETEFTDIVGWNLSEVVKIIRGTKGTPVTLQIEKSDKTLKEITIVREKVKLEDQAAKKAIIEVPGPDKTYKIGIIDLPTFYMDFDAYRAGERDYKSTTKDVVVLITQLKIANVDGIIIDLRSNGGGSLREAASLTDIFIDQGPVVQIRNADQQVSRRFRSQRPALYDGPILVLINHLSASASEIFAGAIQDYERGLIVGEQSYGKGTVQTLTDLPVGQLKYTSAKFYRISGDSTQNRGVIPDITFPSTYDFEAVGESNLDYALPWDQIHPIPHQNYHEIAANVPALKTKHEIRMEKDADYQYLLDRIDFLKKRRDDKTLSLNQVKRQTQSDEDNQYFLGITNQLRITKGQEPFATFKDLEDFQSDRAAQRSSSTVIDTEDDFILKEGAQILIDYISMGIHDKNESRVANNKPLVLMQ